MLSVPNDAHPQMNCRFRISRATPPPPPLLRHTTPSVNAYSRYDIPTMGDVARAMRWSSTLRRRIHRHLALSVKGLRVGIKHRNSPSTGPTSIGKAVVLTRPIPESFAMLFTSMVTTRMSVGEDHVTFANAPTLECVAGTAFVKDLLVRTWRHRCIGVPVV